MDELLAIGAGVLLGIACALPAIRALAGRRRAEGPSLKAGLISVIVAFLAISALMFAASRLWPAATLPFGTSCTLTYLAAVVVAALRR